MGDRRRAVFGLVLGLVTAGLMAGCHTAPTPTPTPMDTASSSTQQSSTAELLAGRAAHTATATVEDMVVVAGGCVVDGCGEATASAFLVGATAFRPTAPMHVARDAHTAVRLENGQVLVVGGFEGEGRPPLASAEVYDPSAGRWSLAGDLATARGGHAAALLGDGRVVVAGGWIGPHRYTEATEIYDPTSQQFSTGPNLPDAADGLTATSLDDGTVLITGGQIEPGLATAKAVVISQDGQTVTEVGSLHSARFKHAAVKIATGEILIAGGTSDDEELLASTEIYNPATRRFRPGPTISAGRYKLAGGAVTLPDGRVVLTGSGAGLEIVDLAQFTSRTVQMGSATSSSFATISLIGTTVRVIGGYDRSIQLNRSDLTIPLRDLG